MDSIELRGLTYYGYHGAFAEEQRLGQRFVVDLRLGLNLEPAGRLDDLERTVDYGKVAETVRTIVEGAPFRLIEALAQAIAEAILDTHTLVETVRVRVEKPSAPVSAAPSGLISVEIERGRDRLIRPVSGGSGEMAATGRPAGSVLSAQGIRTLLAADPPLLSPVMDGGEQIQPNGFDLSLESVWRIDGAGVIGRTNAERVIAPRVQLAASGDGWFHLELGAYIIQFREVVALPLDVMALGRPRSSVLRCGAAIHTAVWDAGYHGRSEALLVVYAVGGLRLAIGARVLQLVFVRLETPTHAYAGSYQGENLPAR